MRPPSNAGAKFIGRCLSKYPGWTSLAYLGIDAQGQTPQRAAMERTRKGFEERMAAATRGLMDVSTGKATATITQATGGSVPAPTLTNGFVGREEPAVVPHEQSVILDLGTERQVALVVFSRDRSGLFVDRPADGYALEGSADGKNWTLLADRAKSSAASVGQIEPWPDRRRPATSDSVSGAATKARCISTRSWCLGSKGR